MIPNYIDLGIKLLTWVITAIEGGGTFLDTIKAALEAMKARHAEGATMMADDVHQICLDAQAINADTQAEDPATHEPFKPTTEG